MLSPATRLGFRIATAQETALIWLLDGNRSVAEMTLDVAKIFNRPPTNHTRIFLGDLSDDPETSKYPAARGLKIRVSGGGLWRDSRPQDMLTYVTQDDFDKAVRAYESRRR